MPVAHLLPLLDIHFPFPALVITIIKGQQVAAINAGNALNIISLSQFVVISNNILWWNNDVDGRDCYKFRMMLNLNIQVGQPGENKQPVLPGYSKFSQSVKKINTVWASSSFQILPARKIKQRSVVADHYKCVQFCFLLSVFKGSV